MEIGAEGSVPEFVRLAGHPLRWQLLTELALGDHRVRELTASTGQPQNLVSYHLGRLRAGHLVQSRRSSADGRDSYYSVDLDRCGALVAATGAALHPGLRLTPGRMSRAQSARREAARTRRAPRVLFLCTGNSARSQMAEALIVDRASLPIRAFSAGSRPKPLHANAVRVMRSRNIDISGCRSKHINEFARRRFDHVITLCDRVREVCPELPGHPRLTHWSMADPSVAGATDAATYPAFERTAVEIERRVDFLLAILEEPSHQGDAHR